MTPIRIPARTSPMPFARGNALVVLDTERAPRSGRWCIGRAYRSGRLVCGCVHARISLDERL
ncbi:MAG: hypothetical protein QOD69_2908, partial [Solirubrobacteraceae bacterium]|nr:hypothetical protein [Solirubrobacteraceae bacterium]